MSCDVVFDFGFVDGCEPVFVGLAPYSFAGHFEYNFNGTVIKQKIEAEAGDEINILFKPTGIINFSIYDGSGNKVCFEKSKTMYFNPMPCEVRCEEIEIDFVPSLDGIYSIVVGNKVTHFGALAGHKMKIPNVFNFTLCEEWRLVDFNGVDVELPDSREEEQINTYCDFVINVGRVNQIPCIIDLCKFECLPSKTFNVCEWKCMPNLINPV